MASSVEETLQQINAALVSSGQHYAQYRCQRVSWDDVQRGTLAKGHLSCWGPNITDTRLYAKDGRPLFTVRGNDWNERLGVVPASQVALVASGHDGSGGGGTLDLRPITLREFLVNPRQYGAYAGLDVDTLSAPTLDTQVSIRFQTTLLPVDPGKNTTLEFVPEAYNYNTLSDKNPRNLVLLCTSQGIAVQQDGKGAKKLFHHVKDGPNVKRYWLEAESSLHRVRGPQVETKQERKDALRRGKATASVIGIQAMGIRFNALMTIQIPLAQKAKSTPQAPYQSLSGSTPNTFGFSMPKAPEYKCILVGDAGVGKSALADRLLSGSFEKTHRPTDKVDVVNLEFHTNRGPIKFNLWDVAGQDNAGGFREGYYVQAKAVILMFDVTSQTSCKNIAKWYKEVMQVCGSSDLPVILCGNKRDVAFGHKLKSKYIAFRRQKNLPYFEVSVKLDDDLEKMFLHLSRRLSGDDSLHFVQAPALCAPEINLSEAEKRKIEEDMQRAASCPLPDLDSSDEEEVVDEQCDHGGPARSITMPTPPIGASSAARVSRGSFVDTWKGTTLTKPVRHPSEHVTVTIVMYHTCSGGVPTETDVRAAVDDLEVLYRSTTFQGDLSGPGFHFMKSELTSEHMHEIHSKLLLQPPKPCAPANHDIFPWEDDDDL